MHIGDFIRKAIKESGTSQLRLSEKLGITQPSLSERLSTSNTSVSVDRVLEMLDELGYELYVRKIKPGRRPEDMTLITREGGDKR